MIEVKQSGNFNSTEKFLKGLTKANPARLLDRYGREGVRLLSAATPVESGETSESWSYEVRITKESYSIVWKNSHSAGGTPVAILLQYGHGTGTGGYVEGRDYINPVIQPLFDKIARDVWKAVTKA